MVCLDIQREVAGFKILYAWIHHMESFDQSYLRWILIIRMASNRIEPESCQANAAFSDDVHRLP